MNGKTNNDVLNLMDEFLSPIKMEKRAADEINEIKKTNGAAPVTPETDKGDGTNQGSFGSEKQTDLEDGMNGAIAADSAAAENKAGGSDKPTDDQGTKSLDSSQAVSQPSVTVNNTSDPQDDNKMNNKEAKMRRNAYLAQNINSLLSMQKTAAAKPTEEDIFIMAFQRGIEKRAEDEAELVEAGLSPEEAEAALDTVADVNPAAVLPEEAEAAPPMEAAAPASAEELAAALDEAGVTVEELAEAVETVQELEQAGVAPEEIVAAVQNAVGEAPAPVDKVAAERQSIIQSHLGLLRANR